MDPFTQGIVGTTVAQSVSKKDTLIIASVIGLLAGLAADLDIFIRSSTDPLLFLEYHRHFTHSIFFIPIGALLCSIVFYNLFSKRNNLSFRKTYFFSFLGYATHGIIDSFTTYGTLLFWPFTNERIAWNTISVIDPVFTLPIFVLVIFSIVKRNKIFSIYAIIWMLIYQTVAFTQKFRAEDLMYDYAQAFGHQVKHIEAKPSFGNIIVWKVIYSTPEKYYVNAIRLGLDHKIYPGESIVKLDVSTSFPWLDDSSQQAKDVEKFRWFSNGYLGVDKNNKDIIHDIRFSTIPNQVDGLWGIKLDKTRNNREHVEYVTNRKRDLDRFNILIDMITGVHEN
tara:strand:- start:4602 stop:5612 length:1011 start_codon:yes stop_codon:yes gene_type:complete